MVSAITVISSEKALKQNSPVQDLQGVFFSLGAEISPSKGRTQYPLYSEFPLMDF